MTAPDRFNQMGGSPSAGGTGTPSRYGQLPPSVIISPSAPVSQLQAVVGLCANKVLFSIFPLQAQQKLCPMTLPLLKPARSP